MLGREHANILWSFNARAFMLSNKRDYTTWLAYFQVTCFNISLNIMHSASAMNLFISLILMDLFYNLTGLRTLLHYMQQDTLSELAK